MVESISYITPERGKCELNCPKGIEITRIIELSRAELVRRKLALRGTIA